jgi:hypothetical protein
MLPFMGWAYAEVDLTCIDMEGCCAFGGASAGVRNRTTVQLWLATRALGCAACADCLLAGACVEGYGGVGQNIQHSALATQKVEYTMNIQYF